ncbi:hypothetical protein CMO91_06525 [Candidatus Woesearchaeota archaeon]|nr:hypothetical protein [Candidatus Woesearchaeota archaeon]
MGAKVAVVQRHREDWEGIRFLEMLGQHHNQVDHFQFPEHVLGGKYGLVISGGVFDSDSFLTGAQFAEAWKQTSDAPFIQYSISPSQSPYIDGNIAKDWGSRGDLTKHYPLVELLVSPLLGPALSTGRLLDFEETFPQVSIDRSTAPGVQIAVVQRHKWDTEGIYKAEHQVAHPHEIQYFHTPDPVMCMARRGIFGIVVSGGVFESKKYESVTRFAAELKQFRPDIWFVMCREHMNNPGPIDGRVPRVYPDHAPLVGMIASRKLHALRTTGDVGRLPRHFDQFELAR